MLNLTNSKKLNSKGMQYLFNATPYITPVLDYGKGSFVWDVDGNRYLDLNSGQFCLSFGHAYQPFIEVVNKQLKKIYHTNTSTLSPEVFEAAEAIATIAGGDLQKTIFLSTGSEANECALRYAQFFTKRNGVLCIDYGYHGLTLGSQGVTMGGKWAMPHVSEFISVGTPDYIHLGEDELGKKKSGMYDPGEDELGKDQSEKYQSENVFINEKIDELTKIFREKGNTLAAMIMEPVIGVGGMVRIPDRYIKAARELCNEYGVVLIFDECQCGFGRSGDWFVYQTAGVYPDILTTAKAMGMGLAVSAVTFSSEISSKIEGKLVHFSSHQNDPISATIVKFVIDEIKKLDILNKNRENGNYLLSCINAVCKDVEFLINPRGVGLMCAFDLDDSAIPNYRDFSGQFIKQLQQNGVLIQAVRQGRTFRIMPSYLTNHQEMDFLRDMVIKSAKEM